MFFKYAKTNKEEIKMPTPKKNPVTNNDICMLERALNLKLITDWEDEFLINLKNRFRRYGESMVITAEQRNTLRILSDRYLKSRGILDISLGD